MDEKSYVALHVVLIGTAYWVLFSGGRRMRISFEQLQVEVGEWLRKNFPDSKPHQALLGVVEEVGELSHSHLKQEQKIRGSDAEHVAKKKDAVGDIVIFLTNYCIAENFSLGECVEEAWNRVKKRDWQKDPANGGDHG